MSAFSKTAAVAAIAALQFLTPPAEGRPRTTAAEPSIAAFENCALGMLKHTHKKPEAISERNVRSAVEACRPQLEGTGKDAMVLVIDGRPRIFLIPNKNIDAHILPLMRVTAGEKPTAG